MDNFGKPNFYGSCAGKNTGEDILKRPLAASFNSSSSVVEECSLPPASMAAYADLQKAEKKRKADREYRERCKRKKDQTAQALESLGKENEELKIENQCLKERNAYLNQSLQSQTGELKEMKYQLGDLKLENEKQNTLVQILSHHAVNPDLCHQNKKLTDENARLREIAKLSDGMLKLVEENGKLKYEKLLLQVQMDALLGQILDGNCQNCGHK